MRIRPGFIQCLQVQGSPVQGFAVAWVRANLEGFLHRDAPTQSVSHACCAACNINKYPARTSSSSTAACMQERRGPLDLACFGCENCAAADTSRFAERCARQQVLAEMMSTLDGSICRVQRTHACPVHVLRYQAQVRARVQGQGHVRSHYRRRSAGSSARRAPPRLPRCASHLMRQPSISISRKLALEPLAVLAA